MKTIVLIFILLFFLKPIEGCSQTNAIQKSIIEDLKRNICNLYISEAIANKMCDSLTFYKETGKYDSSLTIDDFTYALTKDLRRISNDRHISINGNYFQQPQKWRQIKKSRKTHEKQMEKFWKEVKKQDKDKFDYGKIEILPGTIGYLEIKAFDCVSLKKKENRGKIELKDVMKFLKDTKTIIVDLRNNRGGVVNQAAKFCSYFAEKPHTYFTTHQRNYRSDSGNIHKSVAYNDTIFTRYDIPVNFCKGKKVYVLTSHSTFSAGELVSYGIKKINSSSTIVGEQTAGAGNSFSSSVGNVYYSAIVPSGKMFDEENSNYNIEGNGVMPDIKCNPDSALETAYKIATGNVLDNTNIKYFSKKKKYTITQYPINHVDDFIGNYNKVKVIYKDGELLMIYDLTKLLLEQNDDNIFQCGDFKSIFFVRTSGKVVKIKLTHTDGYVEEYSKE